jgi:hypothetical protein
VEIADPLAEATNEIPAESIGQKMRPQTFFRGNEKRDFLLGVWIPIVLGIVSVLCGWGLTKIENNLPAWAPTAAFALSAILFVLAIALGFIATRRGSPIAIDSSKRGAEDNAPLVINQNVTSRHQSGGVTAHTINERTDL